MHPTPILATFSNISGCPKDMVKSEKTCNSAIKWLKSNVFSLKTWLKGKKRMIYSLFNFLPYPFDVQSVLMRN